MFFSLGDTFESDDVNRLRVRSSDNHASFHETLNDKTKVNATTMSTDHAFRPSTANRSHSQSAFNSYDHQQNLQNNGKHNFGGDSTIATMRGSEKLSMSMTIPSNQTIQPSSVLDVNANNGSGSSGPGMGGMKGNGGYIDMQARTEKRGPVTPKPFLRKGSRKVSCTLSSSPVTHPILLNLHPNP